MSNNSFERVEFEEEEDFSVFNALKPYFLDESIELHIAIICVSSNIIPITDENLKKCLKIYSGKDYEIIDFENDSYAHKYLCGVINVEDIPDILDKTTQTLHLFTQDLSSDNEIEKIINFFNGAIEVFDITGLDNYNTIYTINNAKKIQEKWEKLYLSINNTLALRIVFIIPENIFNVFDDSKNFFPNQFKYVLRIPSYETLFYKAIESDKKHSKEDILKEGKAILSEVRSGRFAKDEFEEPIFDDFWKELIKIAKELALSSNELNKSIEDKEKKNNVTMDR